MKISSVVHVACVTAFFLVTAALMADPKGTQKAHEVYSFVFEGILDTKYGSAKVWIEEDSGDGLGLVRIVHVRPLNNKTGTVDEKSSIGSIAAVDFHDDGEWDTISICNEPIKGSTGRTGINSMQRVEAGKWGWKWEPCPADRNNPSVMQFDDAKIKYAIAELTRAMDQCHALSNLVSARRWSEKQGKMVDVASWTAKESKP